MQLLVAFINNPVKVSVAVLLVALFGSISLLRMPMQLTPEVEVPTISVETRWPGAAPQEVESEIVQAQEEQLSGVEGARKMTSESYDSRGEVTLEFEVGTDLSEALVKVNARLQQVREYPDDVEEPVISTSRVTDRSIAWFILRPHVPDTETIVAFQKRHPELAKVLEPARRAHNTGLRTRRLSALVEQYPQVVQAVAELLPPELDVPTFRRFAEDFIEAEFERVDGVANANVLGGREEELQVVIDPHRLAARQLTIDDVRLALRGQNVDTSGGDIWEGKRRWVVRTLGKFRSPEQVGATILARREGSPVYVRDVALVRLGYKKPDGLVRNFGSTAIAINVQRSTGANVLDVMEGLRNVKERLNHGILSKRGLQLEQVYDETDYIYSAVGLVNQNIILGGVLTIAALLLFLRSGRSTLVVGLAIPTSIIGTFIILFLLGRSLNVISLAGLAFAVGMLVDNAIVVLENIYRHFQQGDDPLTAAVNGSQEVWGAVVASTLTTLAVFVPVVFVQEEAGQLFRDIALAVSTAVGLSLVVSVTVIPTAAARIFGWRAGRLRANGRLDEQVSRQARHAAAAGRPAAPSAWRFLTAVDVLGQSFVEWVVQLNRRIQRGTLLRLGVVVLLLCVSLVLSYLLLPKVEYLPQGNRNLVFGMILPPPGYNIDQLAAIGQQIEADLQPYWDIDPQSPEADRLEYPPINDFFFVARGRRVFLGLRAEDPLRAGELQTLVQQVGDRIPGAFIMAKQSSLFERGITAGRTIDIEITGPEVESLVAIGGQVLRQIQDVVPGAQAMPIPSLDLSSPELHVTPKWEQSADMQLNSALIGYAVDALVDGAKASDYYFGGDKIDLSILGDETVARRTQDLGALPVAAPTGQVVPLAALADIRLGSGPEQINRSERQRVITVQVTPPRETPLEDALENIQRQIVQPLDASGQLNGMYRITLSGTADKLREAWSALWFNLLLALLITYLLMAGLFESWLYPMVIILSVPLGAVGGFAGLAILNLALKPFGGFQPLDVLTMLGFVILIGTVVNNPILIVHQSLHHMRIERMNPADAVLKSVRLRIRPIFMTTLTTILGLLPLVLFPGAGSELYRGLGSVLLGGLLVSTVFTLVLVPSLFTLALDARQGLLRRLGLVRMVQHDHPDLPPVEDDNTPADEQPPPPRIRAV